MCAPDLGLSLQAVPFATCSFRREPEGEHGPGIDASTDLAGAVAAQKPSNRTLPSSARFYAAFTLCR